MLRIACNYVLHPAIAIYTVILYLYAISILVNWELPKGGISYMVFAFFMVAFAGMTMQVIAAKPVFKAFYRYFTYIAIPPLCLFWMGALCRIQMYGFTEMRVYLIVCGLIVTLCTASLFCGSGLRSAICFHLQGLQSHCSPTFLKYRQTTSASCRRQIA